MFTAVLGVRARSWAAWARRGVTAAVICASLVFAVVAVLPAAPAQAQSPPPKPGLNALGGNGPCSSTSTDAVNSAFQTQTVLLIQPQGTANTPRTGGTCGDSNRPVVVLAHGWVPCDPDGTPPDGDPGGPLAYGALVNNLVSNGFIVAFPSHCLADPIGELFDPETPTYDMIDTGFDQAMDMTMREDTTRVGVIGHSFGGGMAPWLAEEAWDRGWGTQALWLTVFAPIFPLRGGDPFDLPQHTRSLNVIFQDDHVCQQVGIGWPLCDIPGWSAGIYERLEGISQRWGLGVNTDVSHSPPPDCSAADNTGEPLCAHHYVPSYSTDTTHLQYYGVYRNVQALWACTVNASSADCNTDRTFMGVWSDNVPATPATHCTPTSCS